MRFRDLNWIDVERYLQTDNRVILITGATEQHNQLSLMTDVRISEKIADAVCVRDNVLIAPPINFGISTHFMDFPGTITIAKSTFDALLSDIVQGLLRQGFGNFLILNGHQSNRFPESLTPIVEEGYAQIVWFDWWNSNAAQEFEAKHNLRIEHANWSENFAFNRVITVNQYEQHYAMDARSIDRAAQHEQIEDPHTHDEPYQIDDRLMFQLLDDVVDEVFQLLMQMRYDG